MKQHLFGLTLAMTTSFATFAPVAMAQDAEITQVSVADNQSAKQRINLSGKLRMLSQRIPSAACYMEWGIAGNAANELLVSALAEFEQILTALAEGDAALQIIGAETDRKILAKLDDVRARWEPFKTAANAAIAGTATDADIDHLLTENMELLKSAQALVIEVTSEYTNPAEVLQANSMVIDIAGRQRTLTQKIAKENCIAASGRTDLDAVAALEKTSEMFETTLYALRHGMQAAGIMPPPTTDISTGLELISTDWEVVRPWLDNVMAGESIDNAAHAEKFVLLNKMMADMNKVVGLYATFMDTKT